MSSLRVGNCSGFYGDRLSAMREMLEGGPGERQSLDYLTGDYLAELTMLILGKDTMKDPSLGYARTFVRQVEDCLGLALESGVKIVSNAGGLNPAGLAGHIIECGTQATGGNFSGFRTLRHDGTPIGFPVAELAADGSSVITKHQGTGGAVTVDTVTAQLVYEIQSTRYLGPDVTTLLDSVELAQEAPDRVAVTGVRGDAPPEQLKVCVNEMGGFRNTVEFVLTGLDIEAKADWVREQLTAGLAANRPAEVTWSQTSQPLPDADSEEAASCLLRCTVKDPSPDPVGKPFSSAAVELALASYPGFTMTGPPPRATPFGVYRPAYVDREQVVHSVVHADGRREVVPDPEVRQSLDEKAGQRPSPFPAPTDHLTRRLPLGTFVHARSGDKGGDANLGLWVTHEVSTGSTDTGIYDARVTWLLNLISPGKVRDLIPEARDLEVEVFPLPNLGAVNVLIRGLLGDGVASSTRFDPQAKGLGEWARSRMVNIEESLL